MERIWQGMFSFASFPPWQLSSSTLSFLVILRLKGLLFGQGRWRGGGLQVVSSRLTSTNYLTKWKSPPFLSQASPLTTEHTVTNESTDGCYWNGLIIFMCSWKYHWVRWRRFRLRLLPLVPPETLLLCWCQSDCCSKKTKTHRCGRFPSKADAFFSC